MPLVANGRRGREEVCDVQISPGSWKTFGTDHLQYRLSRDQGMVAGRVHSELESRIIDVLVSDGGLNTFGK